MELSFQLEPTSGPIWADINPATAVGHFQYLPEYKVLVCKEHGYGIKNLKRHLQVYHNFRQDTRAAIEAAFGGLDIVEPFDAIPPRSKTSPIESLGPPKRGYLCGGTEDQDCGVLSISRDTIGRHCREAHGWMSTKTDPTNWTSAKMQSFCLTPGKQRWFVVQEEGDEEESMELPVESFTARNAILGRFRRLEKAHEADLDIIEDELAKTDRTGWWKKTGWVEHLGKSNLAHLAHAARLPDNDETVLQQVGVLVDAMMEHCVDGLMTLPDELRRWLRSAKTAEADPRPMGRLQNGESQKRYTRYMKRMVCYALRVLQSEEVPDNGMNEERNDISMIEESAEENNPNADELEESIDENHHSVVEVQEVTRDQMHDARRLFPWKDGQKDRARRLLQSIGDAEPEERQLEALMEFSETFIFHKIYRHPFENPTIHFLAVLGIDEENKRLRTGNDYSYMLAGLVYCLRVVALERLLPLARREQQGEAEVESFLECRRKYLADGSMSAMSTMISLLAYGKYLAMNHSNPGMMFWEKGGRVLRMHGQPIAIDKFRAMVVTAIDDIEDLFWEKLMWTTARSRRFEIDLDRVSDDFTFQRRDASFRTNKTNKLQHVWEDVVMERMFQSPTGKKLQRDGGKWQTRRVREYLRVLDRFRLLLAFCVHVTGGQPARGTELLSMRHKNGQAQDRNVYILDGHVMAVTRYNKTSSQWDTPKVVPRFLPWRLGQVTAIYLSYIQPFVERMSADVGVPYSWSQYIWANENGPWETEKLSAVLEQRTSEGLGVPLGTLAYRHVAVGIGRQFVGEVFATGYQVELCEIEEPELEKDSAFDISSGHGSAQGVSRYAVPSDVVKHLSQRNIDTFRPLSQQWHHFLGLSSRKPPVAVKRPASPTEYRTPNKRQRLQRPTGLHTPATSEGSMHAPSTGLIHRARSWEHFSSDRPGLRTPSSMVPVTPRAVGRMSIEPSSPPLTSDVSYAVPPSSPPVISLDWDSLPSPRPTERDAAVRRALGKEADETISYRSPEQEQALNRIMDGSDSSLVVVLPTGGGKTLLFTAPACLDDPGMTIVVVPYRQLITETVQDARDVGIRCVEWSNQITDPVTLIIVSADKLTHSFFDYVARMASRGLVRRVFVDECHLAVTAHHWRPKMMELAKIRTVEAPLVMLTATLPIWMENDLETTMSTSMSTAWIRASTSRRTTSYVVRTDVSDGRLLDEAANVIRKRLARLRPKEKMVVFCREKKQCDALAKEIGCGVFYAGSPDNDAALDRWKAQGGCIVATTALGTGVSYPGIVATIHVGMPYGMVDFFQESGRAGRGGEAVDSLILVEKDWIRREGTKRASQQKAWTRDEQTMVAFVGTPSCRRLVSIRYFDREPAVDCISSGVARCDRCSVGVTDWQRTQQTVAVEKDTVLSTLDQVAGNCVVCWMLLALGGTRGWLHSGQGCCWREVVDTDEGGVINISEQACDDFRTRIRYLDGSKTCYRCGISQRMCRTRVDSAAACQWPHVAIPVVRMAMTSTIGRNIIRQAGYEDDWEEWDAYALWLGQPHRLRVWGELASNSMVVIAEFLIYCSQEMKSMDTNDIVDEIEEVEEMGETAGVVDEVEEVEPSGELVETDPLGRPARLMGPVADVSEIRRLLGGWKDRCVLCKARQRPGIGHNHWTKCTEGVEDRIQMEKAVGLLGSVRFANFSGCKFCKRPQAVCETWERKVKENGPVVFRMRPGSRCEYGDWLLEATAVLLAVRERDGLKERQRQDSRLESTKTEMGRKERRGEVEFNGMLEYFYRWAW